MIFVSVLALDCCPGIAAQRLMTVNDSGGNDVERSVTVGTSWVVSVASRDVRLVDVRVRTVADDRAPAISFSSMMVVSGWLVWFTSFRW